MDKERPTVCPFCGRETIEIADSTEPYCEPCHRYIRPTRGASSHAQRTLSLSGIRGWLILPAIGIVLNPILLLAGIAEAAAAQGEYGRVIDRYPTLGTLLTVEIVGAGIALILSVVLLFAFFGKRRSAPSLFIWSSVVVIGLDIITTLISTSLRSEFPEFAGETIPGTVARIVVSAIWIAYFKVSPRVEATFVN